jgi:hypothetical protein
MFRRRAAVILITYEHRFIGRVPTGGQRLLDILNDRSTDYVHVHDVEVFRNTDPETCIATFPEAVVRKADLSLVLITGEKHEAPEKRLYGFVPKKLYHVFLTVPGYEVQGRLHLALSSPEPVTVLARETGDFFPVTQATVSQVGGAGGSLQVPVIIINKASIALFYVGETPITS